VTILKIRGQGAKIQIAVIYLKLYPPDKISMKLYPRVCNILKNIILIEKKYYPIEGLYL
jgi:hypothetical protein